MFGTNTNVTTLRGLQEQLGAAYSDLEAKVMFQKLDLEGEGRKLRR